MLTIFFFVKISFHIYLIHFCVLYFTCFNLIVCYSVRFFSTRVETAHVCLFQEICSFHRQHFTIVETLIDLLKESEGKRFFCVLPVFYWILKTKTKPKKRFPKIFQSHTIITYRFLFISIEIWSTISMQCISPRSRRNAQCMRRFSMISEKIFHVINSRLVVLRDRSCCLMTDSQCQGGEHIFSVNFLMCMKISFFWRRWRPNVMAHVIWYFLTISAWNNKISYIVQFFS